MYELTASIVAYHSNPDELKNAIHSFLSTPIFPKKLIIIDHSPTNELMNIISTSYTTEVEYYHHPENRGFGAGHNIALRKVMEFSSYHLVLNPDVSFNHNVLVEMVDYMNQDQQIGSMMPKILNQNKELQYLAKLLPTPTDLIFKRFLPKNMIENRMNRFQLKFTGYQDIMNVPYLSGCFMLLNCKAILQVGIFDERYFMYPEDIDLTRRIHEEYKTLYYPYVEIIHRHEASSYKDLSMLWVHLWNMVKYFNKWGWYFDSKRKRINREVLFNLKATK